MLISSHLSTSLSKSIAEIKPSWFSMFQVFCVCQIYYFQFSLYSSEPWLDIAVNCLKTYTHVFLRCLVYLMGTCFIVLLFSCWSWFESVCAVVMLYELVFEAADVFLLVLDSVSLSELSVIYIIFYYYSNYCL